MNIKLGGEANLAESCEFIKIEYQINRIVLGARAFGYLFIINIINSYLITYLLLGWEDSSRRGEEI